MEIWMREFLRDMKKISIGIFILGIVLSTAIFLLVPSYQEVGFLERQLICLFNVMKGVGIGMFIMAHTLEK